MVCDRLYCLVSILFLYSYQENFKSLLLINSVICDNRSQQISEAFEQRILDGHEIQALLIYKYNCIQATCKFFIDL